MPDLTGIGKHFVHGRTDVWMNIKTAVLGQVLRSRPKKKKRLQLHDNATIPYVSLHISNTAETVKSPSAL